jgi:hypothetical protein
MVAYEFYFRDNAEGAQLIGILPERRKNPERITSESILKWGKDVVGDAVALDQIFFVQVEV